MTMTDRIRRRAVFAKVRQGVVAVAVGFPEHRETVGYTTVPVSSLLQIVGTGFLVERGRGLVVTAAHVAEKLHEIDVKTRAKHGHQADLLVCVVHPGSLDPADGKWTSRFETRYVRNVMVLRPADLGILTIGRVPDDDSLQPLIMALDACEVGDEVISCGFPHGLRLHNNVTVNASFGSGIVSTILPSADSPPLMRTRIQFDTVMLGGSSGGPLVDVSTGEVVGVVVSNYAQVIKIPLPGDVEVEVPHPISFAEDISLVAKWMRGEVPVQT